MNPFCYIYEAFKQGLILHRNCLSVRMTVSIMTLCAACLHCVVDIYLGGQVGNMHTWHDVKPGFKPRSWRYRMTQMMT